MITETGREIISRYLLGHTSTYASHISVGVGAAPYTGYRWFFTSAKIEVTIDQDNPSNSYRRLVTLTTSSIHPFEVGQPIKVVQLSGLATVDFSGNYTIIGVEDELNTKTIVQFEADLDIEEAGTTTETAQEFAGTITHIVGDMYSDSPSLTFETMRLPIISRGYVNNDTNQLTFAAELPTNDRIIITEAGLWTAEADANPTGQSSKMLFSMDEVEGWMMHGDGMLSSLPSIVSLSSGSMAIQTDQRAFHTASDNILFQSLPRLRQYEGGRIGNSIVGLRGDTSTITGLSASGTHIHATTQSVDFSNNNSNDEIKIALFVSAADQNDYQVVPGKVDLLLEFLYSEGNSSGFAKVKFTINGSKLGADRYKVVSKQLSDFMYSPNFSWSDVKMVKISVAVTPIEGTNTHHPEDFFVFIDGIRFENTSSINPLYGMTAFSVVRDGNVSPPSPIISATGEPGYIEFRLNLEVI